jgi:hypothetical protein
VRKTLAQKQAEMRERHARRPARGRRSRDNQRRELLEKSRFIVDLARRLTFYYLREGRDTQFIACKLRDAFSLHYVNLAKVEEWIKCLRANNITYNVASSYNCIEDGGGNECETYTAC